jgi:hypothetical protein
MTGLAMTQSERFACRPWFLSALAGWRLVSARPSEARMAVVERCGRVAVLLILLVSFRQPAVAARFTRGDCDASGNVASGTLCELVDSVFLLNYLFLGGRMPPCLEACDANGDAELNVADAVFGLNFCFVGGRPPPAPFPACDEGAGDTLGCAEFPPCARDCRPMDVRGVGPCAQVLGVYWDGARCTTLSGCSCEGEDCDRLYASEGECAIARGECPEPCIPMDVEGVGPCDAVLGYFWDGTDCKALSGCSCAGPDCDRLTSLETCMAAHGRCPPPCRPMDARGVGGCEAIRGYAWDGRQCLAIVGCSCEGEDCDRRYVSLAECLGANADCPPVCAPMEARGAGDCDLVLGYVWDGAGCQALSGCSCEGAGCGGLFRSLEECAAAQEGCP